MLDSQRVRLALLGCGRFGWRHLEAWRRIPDVDVVVVSDIDEPRARTTAQRFGVSSYTTDFREAAAWPGVDAVDVCLPTYLHCEAVIEAARHGRHVFCEKPLGLTPAQAQEATAACWEAGVKLQVGFCRRFDNAWLTAASIIRQGLLGRPVVWRHATGTAGAPQPWFFEADQGGGPFVDGAIHWYDFARWVFGEAESVVASTRSLQRGRTAPDTGIVSVRFASGDELQLMWSWGLPHGIRVDEQHEVIGPNGALAMLPRPKEDHPPSEGINVNGRDEGLEPKANGVDPGSLGYLRLLRPGQYHSEPVPYPRNNMVDEELAAFARAVREGTEPPVGGVEAIRALEIAMAVLESSRTGQAVRLSAIGVRSPLG